MSAAKPLPQSPHPDHDPVRRAMLASVHAVAAALMEKQQVGDPEPIVLAVEEWTITVSASKRESQPAAPTPCEFDLLVLLTEEKFPRSATWILGELEARNRLHGESTVRHTLTGMVRRGWLVSSRKAPKGYTVTAVGRDARSCFDSAYPKLMKNE